MSKKATSTDKSRKVWTIDTTLRDGEQTPGVCFHRADKLAIAQALDDAGINELEVGTPIMGSRVQEDIRRIVDLGLGCRLSVWCRAHVDDLAAAARCRVAGVHFSFPVSAIHLAALNRDRTWVLSQLERLVRAARRDFDCITIGAQDATRADPGFLMEFARRVKATDVQRLRLADTVGIGRPATVVQLVVKLKQAVPDLDLEFHGHNDTGMATANALSALEAGARAVSATVNGLGERAGNTALEQVAMALHLHPDLDCAMETKALLSLCRLVARAAGQPIAPAQPVVGQRVFAHESGIHCHAMLKDDRAYEPFAPSKAGHQNRLYVLGAHSGTTAIRHLLGQAGIRVSARQARNLKLRLAGCRGLKRRQNQPPAVDGKPFIPG